MLTDDDKQWLLQQNKAEFQRLHGEIQQLMGDVQQLKGDVQQLKGEIERVETSLLTEFHKWASPVEMRQRTHAAAIKAIDAEMEFMSDRLKKLEGR